jgi:hypothetical protein
MAGQRDLKPATQRRAVVMAAMTGTRELSIGAWCVEEACALRRLAGTH